MKTNLKFLSAALLTAVLVAAPITTMAAESTFGAGGAAGDGDYTLDEMLTYAIQDEYLAQAEYEAIMDQHGVVRPFSNIIRAEATHISLLLPLFTAHDVAVPENDADDRTVVPATLAESYAAGVDAEIKNIAMYESFLMEDLPADVEAVFENLQAASENHLAAFERADSGDFQGTRNGNGRMNGNGNGNGTGVGNGGTAKCLI